MNIIDEISSLRGCHSCIALTFNFDIAWFESLVYQRLITAGVRRILIITDTAELSSTIQRQAGAFLRAGIDYSVIGIDVPGCFHPKAVFLSGNNTGRLYVGSGNITSNGFGRNLEVYERFEATKDDTEIPLAFDQFRNYLEQILQNHFGSVPKSIHEIMTHAFGGDLLTRRQSENPQPTLLGSPNELFGRLDVPEQPIDSLIMLAPYFDSNGDAVLNLAKKLKAIKFTVITDKRRTNLCTNAANAIKSAGGAIKFLDTENERPLHAKIVFGKGKDWAIGISGSANLSIAAWYGHNAELVVVRRDDLSADLEGLLNSLQSHEASEKELQELGQYRFGEDENDVAKPSLPQKIVSAKWVSLNQIGIELSGPITIKDTIIEFIGPKEPHLAKKIAIGDRANQLDITPCESVKRGQVVSGRIIHNGVKGPYFVIEDSRKLAEHAQTVRRLDEYAKELLFGSDVENPPEKLLKYLSSVYRNRVERLKKNTKTAGEDDKEDSGKQTNQNEWVEVFEDDFETHSIFNDSQLSYYQSTGGRLRLINLLLFGSETPINADPSEGESELDENGTEPQRPPRGKSMHATKNVKKRKHSNLAEIVVKARELYLEDLHSGVRETYPLGRIVEDMQVICAAIHSAFEAGYISEMTYRIEFQSILSALLGNPNAPFNKALSEIPEDKRAEEWEETSLLLAISLLLYNYCLSYSDGAKAETTEIILWFRHLLSFAPRIHVQNLINDIDRQLPKLKNGVFWLHNSLGSQIELNPFQEFLKNLVESTYTLLEFEKAVPTIKPSRLSAHDLDENDKVVHQLPDGQLKVGFAEEDPHHPGQLQVWIRENPFDDIMPREFSCRMARPRGSIKSIIHFSDMLTCVKEAKIENYDKAFRILNKLTDR